MRRLLLVLLLLLLATPAPARMFPSAPDAARSAQLRWGGPALQGYVVAGCLHAPAATTTVTVPPCQAYSLDPTDTGGALVGFEEEAAVPLTFPAVAGQYYVAGRDTPTRALAGWTCLPGQHYCWQQSPTRPVTPAGGLLLSASTVSSAGAVTAVLDLRPGQPFDTVVNVLNPLYGVAGDGVTDDTAGLTRACQALFYANPNKGGVEDTRLLLIPGGRTYLVAAGGWQCPLITNTTVLAYGATLQMTAQVETPLVDVNPQGDCSGATSPVCLFPLRQTYWLGGVLRHSGSGTVQTVGMKIFAVRGFTIRDAVVSNFFIGLDVAIQDNFLADGLTLTIGGSGGYGIVQRAGVMQVQASDGWQVLHSKVSTAAGVTAASAIAMNAGGNHGSRQVEIMGNTLAGLFTNTIYLTNGTPDCSSASRQIYVVKNHFEQGDQGLRYIYLNPVDCPHGFDTITITDNHTGSSVAGHIDIELGNAHFVTVARNRVAAPEGIGSKHLVLTGNFAQVEIGPTQADPHVQFLDISGATGNADRHDIQIYPTLLTWDPTPGNLPNYDSAFFSDTTRTLDMSTELTDYPTRAAPRGYWVHLSIDDSGSAAAPALGCFVRLAQSATATNPRPLYCNCAGTPNNNILGCNGYVQADANGDIYLEVQATGSNTLHLRMGVNAAVQ